VPNFEQTKCFINASSQRQVHDKVQYLERIADADFEIWKEKFQCVSDKLELNSKQHQAVKGRFVPTCKIMLLSVSTRLVTIFTGESAPAEILVFVWFCQNRIKGQRGQRGRKSAE